MDMSMPDVSTSADQQAGHPAMPVHRCTPPLVERLKEILVLHPGDAEVHVKLQNGWRTTMLRLGPFRVAPTTALMGDLKSVLGPANVS